MAALVERDLVLCRHTVRKLFVEDQFPLVNQTKMITAASELSSNAVVCGRGGAMRCKILRRGIKTKLRGAFDNKDPAIPDLGLVLTRGWTSKSGMGMGLPGSLRLVNEFDLRTAVGEGTCVTITRWQ